MKYVRALFYLLMTALLIAGLYSGLRVFYLLFFSCLIVIGIVLALNIYTIYTFKYKQELSQNIYEAQDMPDIHISLYNENFFPLSILDIRIQIASPSEKLNLTFSLQPFSEKNFQVPIHLPYCGVYQVGMTTIRIFDVFDLVPFRFDMRRLSYYRLNEIIVLPKAYPIDAIPGEVSDTKDFAQRKSKMTDQGESFIDMRLYQKGDPIKRIHWKKSAQHNTLYIKQYDVPEIETITLLLDSSRMYKSKIDQIIHVHTLCESAATIALRALRRHRAIRLIFSDHPNEVFTYSSISEFDTLREELALHAFSENANDFVSTIPQMFAQTRAYKEVYLISGQNTDVFFSEIELYARQMKNFLLIQIEGQPEQGLLRKICIPKGGDIVSALTTGAI